MRLLIVDNYDSFTYNLVESIRQHPGIQYEVCYNDYIDIQYVESFEKILLSPGPGLPREAGLTNEIIRRYAPTHSILGVCLGHQAIASVFGGSLYQLSGVYHGHAAEVRVTDPSFPLFKGIPGIFKAGLYHSWAVSSHNLPECIHPVAISGEGILMALQHSSYRVYGLQFHPESVMTPAGIQILNNWLNA